MIPKNLIVCSFGNQQMRPEIEGICAESRDKFFGPEWNKIWLNEDSFDINMSTYTKLAYERGFYSYVADYARTWALYTYGGIYLDTDQLMLKELTDDLLNNEFFIGSCILNNEIDTCGDLTSWGLVGAEPGAKFIKAMLDKFHDDVQYIDGMKTSYPSVMVYTKKLLKNMGFSKEKLLSQETVTIDGVTIYPFDYFTCCFWNSDETMITDRSYGIQLYGSSWQTKAVKQRAADRIHKMFNK